MKSCQFTLHNQYLTYNPSYLHNNKITILISFVQIHKYIMHT